VCTDSEDMQQAEAIALSEPAHKPAAKEWMRSECLAITQAGEPDRPPIDDVLECP